MFLPHVLKDCCESTQNSRDKNTFLLKSDLPPIPDSLFIRYERISFSGCHQLPLTQLSILSLTISNATITFTNVHLKAKIEVISGGSLCCDHCIFEPFDDTTDAIITVSERSQAVLIGCKFANSNRFSLIFQDESRGNLVSCDFHAPEHSSILIASQSSVVIRSSKFANSPRFAVYIFDASRGIISNCEFGPQAGKSVLAFKNSICTVSGCRFEAIHEGAITIAENSKASVCNCDFLEIRRPSIHGMAGCVLQIENSRFRNCRGNGVNFEFASGFLRDSYFENFVYPAIAIFGTTATPVISNCVIEGAKGVGVVARDGCAPIFRGLSLNRIGLNGFSISDFSQPLIIGCALTNIELEPLVIFNGARPTFIENCITCTVGPAFSVLTDGRPSFHKNVFVGATACRLDRFGTLTASRFVNNYILNDGVYSQIALKDSHFEIVPQTQTAVPIHASRTRNSSGEMMEPSKPQLPVNVERLANATHRERHRGACLRCRSRLATRVCSPCGHKVACEECAARFGLAKVSGHPDLCPVCSTPVTVCVGLFEGEKCVVCLEAPADTMLLPCGHKCLCYADATRICGLNRQCPICRARCHSFKYQFAVYSQSDEDEFEGMRKESEMSESESRANAVCRSDAQEQEDRASLAVVTREKSDGRRETAFRLRVGDRAVA